MKSKASLTSLFGLAAHLFLVIPQPTAAQELLIFGGTGHEEFLGCINCNHYDDSSICNEYGKVSEYNTNGLFNEYSTFGNSYSSASPWNQYSSSNSVPVVVDREGKFYGYFTINEYRSDAIGYADSLNSLHESVDGDLSRLRDALCD